MACTFTVTGTHTGATFNGMPASGKRITVNGVTILEFIGSSGKCVERWHGADTLPLLQQLGAMSPSSLFLHKDWNRQTGKQKHYF